MYTQRTYKFYLYYGLNFSIACEEQWWNSSGQSFPLHYSVSLTYADWRAH